MSPEPIPVGVVGAGNMGANHVRVYDELPGAELVEVVETNSETAKAVREQYDVDVLEDVESIEQAEAVTVAVPNRLHRDVTIECIEAGMDVLVEKPLALSVEDAQEILDVADDHGTILQVGHIEEYNPAVELLDDILEDEELIAVEAHRLGPFNEHLTRESVVYDLMIHDLSVIRSLIDGDLTYLDAIGTTTRSNEIDHAVATMKFEGDVLGTATASHVTHGKVRCLDVTTRDSFIQLKYQEQIIEIQHRGVEQFTRVDKRSGYRTETVTEQPFIRTREPLANELDQFLECVETRETPRVDGKDGLAVLDFATCVIDSIRTD